MPLINNENDSDDPQNQGPDTQLASWVMEKVSEWDDYRDANYEAKWNEYYRLWRGIWKETDKTRKSERSKLIVPALQQAIESAVAELQEATFGKGLWFDVVDDLQDPEKEDVQAIRKQLHEDFELSKVTSAVNEVFLTGAIYGTGIGKIIVDEITERVPTSQKREDGAVEGGIVEKERIEVRLVPVDARDFSVDPAAKGVDDGLGCAHTMVKPKHEIVRKQKEGIYRKGDVGSFMDESQVDALGESKDRISGDKVKVVEYAGLVPASYLKAIQREDEEENEEEFENLFPEDEYYDDDLVEALVTIANDSFILKAVENPYMMQDRPFIAYQHDTVPNRFWGRGISEKGYNPQKALDAELRARIDAMALAAHPMMAIDATRIPRGVRPEVMPGKTILTNGNPNEILSPVKFPGADPTSFSQSGELERMIQMGTGSMDSAAPVGVSPRNSTASGMSMMLSGSIKKNKRTLQNIGENFLMPFIKKAAWRYMQFDPERYPVQDYKFLPKTTLGIMAREYEQGQLTQLLSTAPPESPAYWVLLKGIYENSSLGNKDQMIPIIDQMLQKSMEPPPPPPVDPMVQVKQGELQIKGMEAQANIKKINADAILSLAKAEAAEQGIQIDAYLAQLQALTPKTNPQQG